MNVIKGIFILLMIFIFIFLIYFLYLPRNKQKFDKYSNIPFLKKSFVKKNKKFLGDNCE